jgi:hypothetical protein
MQKTSKPVSKLKVALLWVILLGNLFFWIGFWAWRHKDDPAPPPDTEAGAEMFRSIFLFVLGLLFLGGGIVSYFIVIATSCLTFDFRRPVFAGYKGKLYLAKIIVPTLLSLGVGMMLAVFLDAPLRRLGLKGQMAFLAPLFLALVPMQIAQMWISIWVPATKRLITKRLAARGIAPAQLQSGVLMGISDPTQSSFKKMTLVEDDIGALWLTDDRLIYWGDTDQFAITRAELLQLERRADAGSTSMLVGTAHVILHVQLPTGNVRQIRLHTEGYWTLGRNRKATDALAESISNWHAAPRPPVPPAIPTGS